MPRFVDYTVAAIRDAIRTVVGWAAALLLTCVAGLWAGMSLGLGEPVSSNGLLIALMVLPVSWLVVPEHATAIVVTFAVTAAAWYVPLKFDSPRLMIAAACVNFATWCGVAAWIFWS